jgi:hypothetical protein
VKISFCVFREHDESIQVYMENTANLGLFVCGTQNRLGIRGKNLCVHVEDAKTHKTEDISVNNGPT